MKGVPGRLSQWKQQGCFERSLILLIRRTRWRTFYRSVRYDEGRLICVFDAAAIGIAAKTTNGKSRAHMDYCIVTSDNPRTESQQKIAADIEKDLRNRCNYEIIDDREKPPRERLQCIKRRLDPCRRQRP